MDGPAEDIHKEQMTISEIQGIYDAVGITSRIPIGNDANSIRGSSSVLKYLSGANCTAGLNHIFNSYLFMLNLYRSALSMLYRLRF